MFSSLIYLFIFKLWFESIYLYFLDLNPLYANSYIVIRCYASCLNRSFFVFFHENIVANYKLMHNFVEEKIKAK